MQLSYLVLSTCIALGGCFSYSETPSPARETVVVPPGQTMTVPSGSTVVTQPSSTTVVCSNGLAPPC